jgi:ATP-dependent RNA helicase RhlE
MNNKKSSSTKSGPRKGASAGASARGPARGKFTNRSSGGGGGRGKSPFGGKPANRGGGGGGRGKKKDLDPKMFVKAAKPMEETKYNPTRSYADMGLHEKLEKSLLSIGFEFPTEIQDKTITQSMNGKDILGIASTGTGKTGAFLIPIIDRLLKEDRDFRTLVVLPTRELANQVQKDLQSMTKGFGIFSICLVGGTPAFRDVKKLQYKNQIVIGTPGRLMDMVERGALKLEKTEVMVLDEFDRMLDMGFVNDIRFLIKHIKNLKQTMLFSATLDKKLKPVIDEVIQKPFEVLINSGSRSSDNVEQEIIRVERGQSKFDLLADMMDKEHFTKTIVFAETKRTVDMIYKNLREVGIKAEYIHGDKTQRSREFSLKNFTTGKVPILIATDVAARGLDIKEVSHVVNYDAPTDYETYIHRIGRTGRAGKTGHAITFVK